MKYLRFSLPRAGLAVAAGMLILAPYGEPAAARTRVMTAAMQADAAYCLVNQRPRSVDALLATLPGSHAESRVLRSLAALYNACSGGTVGLVQGGELGGYYSLRAAVAAVRVAEMGVPGQAKLQSATAWVTEAAAQAKSRDYDPQLVAMSELGDCIVAAAPQASAGLVVSDAGSAEEKAAVAGIRPVLSGCITQGTRMRMTTVNLHLLLAEPLYHRMKG